MDDLNVIVELQLGQDERTLKTISLLPSDDAVIDLQANIKGRLIREMQFLDPLPEQSERVAVGIANNGGIDIYALHVRDFHVERIARAPWPEAKLIIGPDGVVLAYDVDGEEGAAAFIYRSDDWDPLKFEPPDALPIRVTSSSVFVLGRGAERTVGVYEYSLENGSSRLVFRDPAGDVDRVMFDGVSGRLLAARYVTGFPHWRYLVDDPVVELHVALSAELPEEDIALVSSTRDGIEMVFRSSSVQQPGKFFLADAEQREITPLAKANTTWEQGWQLKSAISRVFSIDQPGGESMKLSVSVPQSARGRSTVPAVLLVDEFSPAAWRFNEEVKVLNDLGIAVVQIVTRSRSFAEVGLTAGNVRPSVSAKDIQFAVDALSSIEMIDADRVCLIGHGVGGNAALQAAIRFPDHFRCLMVTRLRQPGELPFAPQPNAYAGLNVLLLQDSEGMTGIETVREIAKNLAAAGARIASHRIETDGHGIKDPVAANYHMIAFVQQALGLEAEQPLLLARDQVKPFFAVIQTVADELMRESKRRSYDQLDRLRRRATMIINRGDDELRQLLRDDQWAAYVEQKDTIKSYLLSQISGQRGGGDYVGWNLGGGRRTPMMDGMP